MTRTIIIAAAALYVAMALTIFAMQTRLPVTLGLAFMRSVFWPVWVIGGLRGSPLPMD